MREITTEALFHLYLDTLESCGSYLRNSSDDVVGYEIFEQFDIGVVSFFHESSLLRLLNAGFINIETMQRSSELRRLALELQKENEWSLKAFRTSTRWTTLLALADEIRSMINVD
ncbi:MULTISPECIES: hypothetical protein [Brevibacillus]|uniref:hypothetical protein n=1 Tax=Brevibacillus TaxID=55080 RepID=UPI00203E30EC|nr:MULTISPECIES: hypothetical protein [Brevibacillus]MCM3080428.1 hypothetical protein [Brevibacillus invocatus]MCM3430650.1 hypothetical protein [Brevibacillus invocatus]MDH4618888.1 hypothetical protein [Brevibacillus sp. AY1]